MISYDSLRDKMKEKGIYDDTAVFFFSDHA